MLWVNGGGQAGSVCSQVLINLFPPQLLIAIGSLRSGVVWSQRVKEVTALNAQSFISLPLQEVISFTLSQHISFQFCFRPWTSRIRIFQTCGWSILGSANVGCNQNINQVVRRHFNHVRPTWTKVGDYLQIICTHILYSFSCIAHFSALCFKFGNSLPII